MAEPIALTIGQQFEVERMGRLVDATSNVEDLRKLCKQVIQAWFCQKAATRWASTRRWRTTATRRACRIRCPSGTRSCRPKLRRRRCSSPRGSQGPRESVSA